MLEAARARAPASATEAASAETTSAEAATEAATKTTAVAGSAVENGADDHAGDDIASARGGLLALLPAAVVINIVLRALLRGLGGGHRLARQLERGADVALAQLEGLRVEPLGVG